MRFIPVLLLLFFAYEFPAYGEGSMEIISPEFRNNSVIPAKFTCEGDDVNPTLEVSGIPELSQELALVIEDPDAAMGTWVHWVVYNIPVVSRIDENSVPGTQGINTANEVFYHGPCPPSGTHRYFFKLYALDKKLNLKAGLSKGALEKAMRGHIIDKAELVGLYKKAVSN